MSTEITMPKLSDTMTEGRLISWKKSVGEKVERGEIIAEGDYRTVSGNPEVIKAYLGTEHV